MIYVYTTFILSMQYTAKYTTDAIYNKAMQ